MRLAKFLRQNKAMILAYDHGIEHGPSDFNIMSVDPENVLNIGLEGDYTGIVLHQGIAEKYYKGAYKEIPMVIKLNGRTTLSHINPVSRQTCSVERALKLQASAVGYTIYDGTPAESEMFQEFGRIVETAHDYGIPVIAWMHPKGPEMHDDKSTNSIAYAARIALELGADVVTVKYNNDLHGFSWVVKSAGRCKVLVSGGEKIDDHKFLTNVHDMMQAKATGICVGRNVWQHPKPVSMTKALQEIMFHNKSVDEAMKKLH